MEGEEKLNDREETKDYWRSNAGHSCHVLTRQTVPVLRNCPSRRLAEVNLSWTGGRSGYERGC